MTDLELKQLRKAIENIDAIASDWLDADEDGMQAMGDVVCQLATAPLAGFIAGTWPAGQREQKY